MRKTSPCARWQLGPSFEGFFHGLESQANSQSFSWLAKVLTHDRNISDVRYKTSGIYAPSQFATVGLGVDLLTDCCAAGPVFGYTRTSYAQILSFHHVLILLVDCFCGAMKTRTSRLLVRSLVTDHG